MNAQLITALICATGAGLVLWYDWNEQRNERAADIANWNFNHGRK